MEYNYCIHACNTKTALVMSLSLQGERHIQKGELSES